MRLSSALINRLKIGLRISTASLPYVRQTAIADQWKIQVELLRSELHSSDVVLDKSRCSCIRCLSEWLYSCTHKFTQKSTDDEPDFAVSSSMISEFYYTPDTRVWCTANVKIEFHFKKETYRSKIGWIEIQKNGCPRRFGSIWQFTAHLACVEPSGLSRRSQLFRQTMTIFGDNLPFLFPN